VFEMKFGLVVFVVHSDPVQFVSAWTSEPVCAFVVVVPSTVVVWVAAQVPEVLQSACMLFDWFWS